eukprot:1143418-Pelagomonas_calceolata.AAC.2
MTIQAPQCSRQHTHAHARTHLALAELDERSQGHACVWAVEHACAVCAGSSIHQLLFTGLLHDAIALLRKLKEEVWQPKRQKRRETENHGGDKSTCACVCAQGASIVPTAGLEASCPTAAAQLPHASDSFKSNAAV